MNKDTEKVYSTKIAWIFEKVENRFFMRVSLKLHKIGKIGMIRKL